MCLALSAAFMSLCAVWGCYFIQVNESFTSMSGNEGLTSLTEGKAGWGLFTYEDGRRTEDDHDWKCYRYSDEQEDLLDDPFATAQLVGFVSNVLLGIAALLFLLGSCCAFPRLIVQITAIIEFLGGAAAGLLSITVDDDSSFGKVSTLPSLVKITSMSTLPMLVAEVMTVEKPLLKVPLYLCCSARDCFPGAF